MDDEHSRITAKPLTAAELQLRVGRMLPGMQGVLYYRVRATAANITKSKSTGKALVTEADTHYAKIEFVVDQAIKMNPVSDDDFYAFVQDEKTLPNDDGTYRTSAFPQDGERGCDLYEYSYVDVYGEPDKQEPPPFLGKSKVSTRSSYSSRASESPIHYDNSRMPGGIAKKKKAVPHEPEFAEDPQRWQEMVGRGIEEGLAQVNIGLIEACWKKEFGHLGKGPEHKAHVAEVLSDLSKVLRRLRSHPSDQEDPDWVHDQQLRFGFLDSLRCQKEGLPEHYVAALKRAYKLEKKPAYQQQAHLLAQAQLKVLQDKADPRIIAARSLVGAEPPVVPPAPFGGKKGTSKLTEAQRQQQSSQSKKDHQAKKERQAQLMSTLSAKLTSEELDALKKDFH